MAGKECLKAANNLLTHRTHPGQWSKLGRYATRQKTTDDSFSSQGSKIFDPKEERQFKGNASMKLLAQVLERCLS